jgi:hypothetical protein
LQRAESQTRQLFIRSHNETLSVVAMRVSNPDRSAAQPRADTQPKLQPPLGIVDHLRRRFARFKVCAHFLEAGGKCLNLFLLFGYRRLLLCIIQ